MDKNLKMGLIIGGVAITLFVILPLIVGAITGWGVCGYEMGEYGMMGPWIMGGFGMGWIMPIAWLVVVGLIVWAVIALTRGASERSRQASALEILKDRYAKGEIDKDEFEAKKKDIG